jgi:hypothetical protein
VRASWARPSVLLMSGPDHFLRHAQEVADQMAMNLARALDLFSADYSGRPFDEVRPALVQMWENANPESGATLKDGQSFLLGQAISHGHRVYFEGGHMMIDYGDGPQPDYISDRRAHDPED